MKKWKQLKRWKKALLLLALILLAAGIGCGIYISDDYPADAAALEVIAYPEAGISVSETEDGAILFEPENPLAGMIFYPGGKVQYEAYAPLMEACAEKGILCVLLHMPGNLAVLDQKAADGTPDDFPEISRWYLAGHSLGGAMAASYVSSHTEEYAGLILLAAYSTGDLSQSGLSVLSVYGSEDGVMNRDSYEKYRGNLPADFTELIIPGGCHAYFGCYGPQNGDGTPSITRDAQIQLTAEAIAACVREAAATSSSAGQ